jgi:NAD(P)-dependent dehydrogenase (short-subunit alcohol dehydrogenase family)
MHKFRYGLLLLSLTLLSGTALSDTERADLDAGKPTVMITGANRGIGLEFVRQYSALDWNIIATARNPKKAKELKALADEDPNIIIVELDVTDHTRIDWLAETYKDQPIDILLSNAGITPKYASAFRRVKGIDFDMASKSFEVNAAGPLKLSQAFMKHVAASQQKKIVIISSKAGSFEVSPKMPMMYSYRASKAALNMFMYTLAFETPKQGVTLTLLSPGQVNTMGPDGPKIPNAIEPPESVSKMIAIMDGLTPEDNGRFISYVDGSDIGW